MTTTHIGQIVFWGQNEGLEGVVRLVDETRDEAQVEFMEEGIQLWIPIAELREER